MGTSKTAKQKHDYLNTAFNIAIERDISLDYNNLKLDFIQRFFCNDNTANQYIKMYMKLKGFILTNGELIHDKNNV